MFPLILAVAVGVIVYTHMKAQQPTGASPAAPLAATNTSALAATNQALAHADLGSGAVGASPSDVFETNVDEGTLIVAPAGNRAYPETLASHFINGILAGVALPQPVTIEAMGRVGPMVTVDSNSPRSAPGQMDVRTWLGLQTRAGRLVLAYRPEVGTLRLLSLPTADALFVASRSPWAVLAAPDD